jgi:hypothetical protein
MKKFFIAFIGAVMFSLGISANDVKASDAKYLKNFDNVRVGVPSKIKVIEADTFSIQVIAPTKEEIDNVYYFLDGETLKIDAKYVDDYTNSNKVYIVLTTPSNKSANIVAGKGLYIADNKKGKKA